MVIRDLLMLFYKMKNYKILFIVGKLEFVLGFGYVL